MSEPEGQLYELVISASGEVRDADGNLLNQVPIEAKAVMTEEQMEQLKPLFSDDKGE